MANFLTTGEAASDLLKTLAANTPEAIDLKAQLGVGNATTPTVPDYVPSAIRTMFLNLLQTDPEIRALVKTIATT